MLIVSNALTIGAMLVFRQSLRALEIPIQNGSAIDFGTVGMFTALAVCFTLLAGLTGFFKRYWIIGTSRRVEADLRSDLFRHLQRLPRTYYDRARTGDLMSRATSDIEAARMALGPAIMYLTDAVMKIGFAVPALLWLNAGLTLWSVPALAGIGVGLLFIAPRLHKASRVAQDQLAAVSARAQESFAGVRVIKSFATEDREDAVMQRLSADYLAANVRLARMRGMMIAWISLFGGIAVILGLYHGARDVIDGRFDIAGLLTFQSLLMALIWPMMAFGWTLSMVQRGAAGLDRIAMVLSETPEPASDSRKSAGVIRGDLQVRGLSFAYNGQPVLESVDFELAAGKTLGIVGPTGSGKSTLVSLLPRLYSPPRGSILLDGTDVCDMQLSDLRGAFAVVPQEAFLFSATLRDNVRFARPDADERVVQDAAEASRLAVDLHQIPGGLDAVVGERGVTLSGGQRQRTALARALAADAPILILDDALSAVDAETEAAILENLERERKARSLLIVAHRVSAVRDADLILYLKDGRVHESGTHDELVAAGGEYADLARRQELEAQIEGMEP